MPGFPIRNSFFIRALRVPANSVPKLSRGPLGPSPASLQPMDDAAAKLKPASTRGQTNRNPQVAPATPTETAQ